MKKVSIIILLTALILSAFTACNGDVFSELMPESKRVITLEIPEDDFWIDFTFDKSNTSVKTKELEIPKDCDTWEEYLAEVADVIKVYYVNPPEPVDEFPLMKKDGKVYFCYNDHAAFGLKLDDSKSAPPPVTIDASAEIVIGGTYTLTPPAT